MASPTLIIILFFLILLHLNGNYSRKSAGNSNKQFVDEDYLTFALNLEYLEAEFFLCGVFGYGLDTVDPELAMGGPPPEGCTKMDYAHRPPYSDIIEQFGYEEIGHLKAIKNQTKGLGFPRPKLDISAASFAQFMDNAFYPIQLSPPFDPYRDFVNYLVAAYVIPYVGLNAYVGTAPNLQDPAVKQLVAGLLAMESGQDAVIRALIYRFKNWRVSPYDYTVGQFTANISALRNKLGNKGIKDEGIDVKKEQGTEGKIVVNLLAGDENSLAYSRGPDEILSIVYGTGNPKMAGGFLPNGADGKIAKSYR